ncbi:hypothetical protein HJ588_01575 [Flexivirga sp. ID2601S]|uniref:DUF8017 domain-containing protein n=1 Tax=Flexivirga aerilata TaxID=1656889 RepID=A0A849AEG6_9MICO|nr:hypothetical protein [Flexivirga aerilata]NNG37966.1 hypothetical protein [Flexivirga aerilata]
MSNQGGGPQGPPEQPGGQPHQSGGQPWNTGGQPTGPNTGPTMPNPQESYYSRYSAQSGEGIDVPKPGGGPGGTGSRGKTLIALAVVLAVVVAAVAVFALTRGNDSSQTAGSSTGGRTPDRAPVTATTWTNPTQAAGGRALQAGWQSMSGSTFVSGQYDVPTAGWTLGEPGDIRGYADSNGKPLITARAPSGYAEGFCAADKKSDSAWVGLVKIGKRDPSDAGPDVTQRFADAIALKKDGTKAPMGKLSAAKQIKVNQGALPALEYTVTIQVGDPDKCDKPGAQYEVRTATYSASGESAMLVVIRRLGVAKELPAADADKIIGTLRPQS